jgi:perosamine synthetase
MARIDENGLGVVLVLDVKSHFLGLLTDGDVRRSLLAGNGFNSSVTLAMNPSPTVAHEDLSDDQIRALLSEDCRHIPVLDQSGRVTRLVSAISKGFEGMVPRFPVAAPMIGDREIRYVMDALHSGWVSSQGSYVDRFEKEFAQYVGTKFALSTSNGTTALHLALAAMNIGPGDEVIVPSFSFVAVANAVKYTGAVPVFVDSSRATWCMDPDHIEGSLTSRTKAIIPVHLYGHPANMEPIIEIAAKHRLDVIEDSAEAHGARFQGRHVGSLGKAGCFSFYGNKVMTTGEGGMVVTDDEDLWARMSFLRGHAMSSDRRYFHPEIGFNYRMTNLQAALGVAQLERLDEFLLQKQRISQLYDELLGPISGIELQPKAAWADSICWLYCILVTDDHPLDAAEVQTRLASAGIETRPFFYPIHQQPPYLRAGQSALPVAEDLAERGICLPSTAALRDEDIRTIAAAIEAIS